MTHATTGQDIQILFDMLASSMPEDERDLVRRAYTIAQDAHAGQFRLSGESYFSHPFAVACILAELGFDGHTVAAALLHDVVEDSDATMEDMVERFGPQVAAIVDGVTKISKMTFESREEAQAENIRKMILAMSQDIRVPIVKLADRLHNMRTLEFQKPHRQQPIAKETMDIYAPLANRLGLHRVKLELEDLSFKYLKPDVYGQIAEWMETNKVVERKLISRIIAHIEVTLKSNDIEGSVWGRIKHAFSIQKKMQEQNLTLDDMHDILAFRVIVKDVRDCYAVLGLLHAEWKPVPGRFKDYISMPKANGYQSLHTTVFGPEGERIEIQIRTEEMHHMAEHGVASHWLYKERHHVVDLKAAPQFEWLREIVDRQRDESDSRDFMSSLRLDLFKDEVYVFTPRGDVKELPEGATPLDFAFLIHTEVGSRCVGAKVNGKLVPLSTTLKSGDTIEIITDKNRHPSNDWLRFVKTAKAKNRIQQYLRTEERNAAIVLGREMLEKEGRKIGINLNRAEKDGYVIKVAEALNLTSVEEVLASVGYARNTPRAVMRRIQSLIKPETQEEDGVAPALPARLPERPSESEKAQKASKEVSVRGIDDVMVRYAHCCNPVPGDDIVGFVSRGRGVVVHTASCPNIQEMEPDRLISVQWEGHESKPYPARIHMFARNETGTLSLIAGVLRDEDINLDNCIIQSLIDGRSEVDMVVEVRDLAHLYRTIDKLRHLPPVLEVVRGSAEEV